jgi:hypothetical protein
MRNIRIFLSVMTLILLSAGLLSIARGASDGLYLPLIMVAAPTPVNTATPTITPTITPTPTETPKPFVYIVITELEYDPPGDDVLGEYVAIENQGTANQNMTGWKLKNEENETFRFPTFTLKAGAGVTVWTKEGANTETELYWGSEVPIWNNRGGDCAYLSDASFQLVDWYCY